MTSTQVANQDLAGIISLLIIAILVLIIGYSLIERTVVFIERIFVFLFSGSLFSRKLNDKKTNQKNETIPKPLSRNGPWSEVPVEHAKNHKLYGVRGWLLVFVASLVTKVFINLYDAIIVYVSNVTLRNDALAIAIFLQICAVFWGVVTADRAIYRKQHANVGTEVYDSRFLRRATIFLVVSFFLMSTPALIGPSVYEGHDYFRNRHVGAALIDTLWIVYLLKSRRVHVTYRHEVRGTDFLAQEKRTTVSTSNEKTLDKMERPLKQFGSERTTEQCVRPIVDRSPYQRSPLKGLSKWRDIMFGIGVKREIEAIKAAFPVLSDRFAVYVFAFGEKFSIPRSTWNNNEIDAFVVWAFHMAIMNTNKSIINKKRMQIALNDAVNDFVAESIDAQDSLTPQKKQETYESFITSLPGIVSEYNFLFNTDKVDSFDYSVPEEMMGSRISSRFVDRSLGDEKHREFAKKNLQVLNEVTNCFLLESMNALGVNL
jgi:hypothetical protein